MAVVMAIIVSVLVAGISVVTGEDTMGMNHSMEMNHSMMNHSAMNHSMMDHSMMNHQKMNHQMMNHNGQSGMHSMMKMFFHTGYEDKVLFEEWTADSKTAMIVACVVMFVVAVLYEGLKFVRELLLQRSLQVVKPSPDTYTDTMTSSSTENMVVKTRRGSSVVSRVCSCSHVVQTILHVIQAFVSYCLMLVFMTYNVWLCVAVLVGSGVGYFLFGWKRAVVADSNDHCQQ
ncbi:high affinity copper uptake protein 1 [Aplysia californica]|uniref:Copper transport protein n=1 Tax=Aplysia californica TaxID=6500 RepID=A0ABM0K4K4_APLCA|nr:high affinity copper uptake protein 1 [Aplysia californica]